MSMSEHWKETLATEFSDDNMYVNHRYVHIDSAIGTGESSSAMTYMLYETALWSIVNKLCRMDRIPRKMKKHYKKNNRVWKWYLKIRKVKSMSIVPHILWE